MNSRLRRRLAAVTGVIVVVVVVVLAVVGGATASKVISVTEAASGAYNGAKVQVTGKVVDNSYSLDGDVLSFSIYDDGEAEQRAEGVRGDPANSAASVGASASVSASANGSPATTGTAAPSASVSSTTAASSAGPQLRVVYDRGVSATFGNQVTAICTGTIGSDGVLVCTELVTKCPSKYENSTGALNVERLRSYGEQIIGKPVKISGTVQAGTLGPVSQTVRFVLAGQEGGDGLPVLFGGALPNELRDGTELVLTGSLNSAGQFEATDVALSG
ncbi:MAG: cytochrome c maturation protein CcmE [Coriobacteriales bacterium]|nr:cytochrome c maturation protein CcmE [Coriobacteriales bacterium]